MPRVMYAAILASLLLLIAIAVRQFSFANDPQRANSNSRQAEPAGDPILMVNPWVRYPGNDLLGKVLLPPELIDASHNAGDAGQAPFVGPQACAECHRGKFEGFLQTSHSRSSQIANAETIKGSFQAPRNRLATRERQLHYRMDTRSDGLYQTAVVGGRDGPRRANGYRPRVGQDRAELPVLGGMTSCFSFRSRTSRRGTRG